MQTNKVISIDVIGEKTGRVYKGDFTIKLVLSQRDEFNSDLRRRQILGPSPDGTPPAPNLQMKAYMLGEIQARTIEMPDFWRDSDQGLDLTDPNVTLSIYDAIIKAEEEFEKQIKEDSEKAYEKLSKGKSK